jgi:hypothetical protein
VALASATRLASISGRASEGHASIRLYDALRSRRVTPLGRLQEVRPDGLLRVAKLYAERGDLRLFPVRTDVDLPNARLAGMSGKSVDASLKAAEAEIALRERLMKEASDLIAWTGADDASFFWFERRERLELVRA